MRLNPIHSKYYFSDIGDILSSAFHEKSFPPSVYLTLTMHLDAEHTRLQVLSGHVWPVGTILGLTLVTQLPISSPDLLGLSLPSAFSSQCPSAVSSVQGLEEAVVRENRAGLREW